MEIRFLLLTLLFLPAPLLSASGFENLSVLAGPSVSGMPIPAVLGTSPEKEWTVMVFVNGKNNLESYALIDVNQMELAGSTEKVNIAVEMGRMNGQSEDDDHSEGDWVGVRRYLIVKDTDTARILSPVIEDRGRADMGSWKELADFVRWAKGRYPARRYALALWDHGNGWKPIDPANAPHFNERGFSLDEETGNEISTPQIALSLKEAGGVDFLMLDGCNMQMASVAYEVKDYVGALTASEENEPGLVVRYARLLGMLNARPSVDAEEFAVNAVRVYRDYFVSGGGDNEGVPVTQSALRLSKMPVFKDKVDAWAAAAMRAEPAALLYAKKRAKIFGEDPEFKDLYDFVGLAGAATAKPELKAAGSDLMRFLRSELVVENWAQDNVSHGISIYVPDVYDPLYGSLAWSRDGIWDDFAKYIAALK